MENGAAPRCSAAVSTRWNSGRLVSSTPTVSPWPTPRAANPAASLRTRSAYSRQVMATLFPGVRNATADGRSRAVSWNASGSVRTFLPL
jgi:hypothetical protein